MARRQGRGRRRSEISRLSQQDVIDLFAQQQYLGSYQQVYTTGGGRPTEKIPNSYAAFAETAYCSSSVVGAVMRVRRDIFRQARFTWREITEDGTGTLMHDDALAVLERPWPNGTTGELLTKMITDVDLCGNSFIANEDDRLRWRRPDWMYVVLSGDPNVDVDVDVIGYVYTPGGCDIRDGKPYLPEDICHWSPIPSWGAQYVGQSWMVSALKDIQADKAATDHKLSFFRNGATLGPIFVMPPSMTPEQFKKFRQANDEAHVGPENAYKPLYIGGGANVTMSSSTFQQLELKATQGAGESRIASLAGIHPAIAGLSEGLQGSSLNAGNFTAARRITSDITLMPLWQDACAALSTFVEVPDGYELWIRESMIPFLREDAKDAADIAAVNAQMITSLVREGYEPKTAQRYAITRNPMDLKHSGLMSVQLQPPVEDQPDPEADGIAAGIDEFLGGGEATRARFNPADHPRNPKGSAGGGRFRSVAQRVVDALQEWARSDRKGDPFAEFADREPLRKVAVARGIRLRRGASRDEIAQALKADLLEHLGDVPEDKPEPKKTAKKAAPKAPDKPKADSKLAAEASAIMANSGGSRFELDSLLGARSKKQLRGIADHLGIPAEDKWTADRLRQEIADRLVSDAEPTGRFDLHRLNDVLSEMSEPPVDLDPDHGKGARSGWTDLLGSLSRSSDASESDRQALHDYKSDAHFRETNQSMDGPIVEGVRSAMAPTDHDMVVWRGDRGLRRGDLARGEWERGGFSSTSASEDVARDFARNDDGSGGQPVLMRIRVPKGTRAVAIDSVLDREGPDDIAQYLSEQEILLDGGLRYKVTKDYGVVRGVRQVDVEVSPLPEPKKAAKRTPDKPDTIRLDAREIAMGLGSEADFAHGSGNFLDDVQQKLDAGKSPTQIAKDLDFSAQTVENSTAIRYGGWGELAKRDPEYAAEQQRLYDEGMARVARLRELADRLRATKRPRTPTKAAPAPSPEAPDLDTIRQLGDPESMRDALDLRKVDELKDMLRAERLPLSGRKRDLVDRLVEHIHGGDEKPAAKRAAPKRAGGDTLSIATLKREPTEVQLAAIDRYGGDGGYNINSGLRKGSGDVGKLEQERHKEAVRQLDSLMESSPLSEQVTLYRKVPFPKDVFGDAADGDLEGHEWTDHGFVSTKVDPFDSTSGGRRLEMKITAPAGTPGFSHSRLDSDEVLLGRGLSYRVTADHGVRDGVRHLDVEVVPAQKSAKKDTRPFPSGGESMTEDQARARQADMDARRPAAEVLADVHELVHNGASPRVLKHRITTGAAVSGLSDAERDSLLDAIPGDREVEIGNDIRAAVRDLVGRKDLPKSDRLVGNPDFGMPFTSLHDAFREDGWVSIADIRDALGEKYNRHEVDETIKHLIVGEDAPARAIPQAAQQALMDRDRDAAFRMGGSNYHWLRFDDPSPQPEPDLRQLRSRAAYLASLRGLTQLGEPGAVVKFDRTKHSSISPGVDTGDPVTVLSPGYTMTLSNGETVTVMRPKVIETQAPEVPKTPRAPAKKAARPRDVSGSTDPKDNGAKLDQLASGAIPHADFYRTITSGPSGQRAEHKVARLRYNESRQEYTVHDPRDGTKVGTIYQDDQGWVATSENYDGELHFRGRGSSAVVAADVLVNDVYTATGRHDSRRIDGATFREHKPPDGAKAANRSAEPSDEDIERSEGQPEDDDPDIPDEPDILDLIVRTAANENLTQEDLDFLYGAMRDVDLDDADYDRLNEAMRAAGTDITPGRDQLHHYWTRGKGLAKWAASPTPWRTLVAHLAKHVGLRKAKIFASRWFIEVFGYAAGSDKNRVAHGKPPRGKRVGPG